MSNTTLFIGLAFIKLVEHILYAILPRYPLFWFTIRRFFFYRSLKVECVGYATVLINKAREEVKTIFGNGSEICASSNGEYQIQKPDSARVLVNQKGICQRTL